MIRALPTQAFALATIYPQLIVTIILPKFYFSLHFVLLGLIRSENHKFCENGLDMFDRSDIHFIIAQSNDFLKEMQTARDCTLFHSRNKAAAGVCC